MSDVCTGVFANLKGRVVSEDVVALLRCRFLRLLALAGSYCRV